MAQNMRLGENGCKNQIFGPDRKMARAQWKWAVLAMVWEAYLVSGFVGSWWLQKPDIRSRPKKRSRAMKMSRSGNGLGSLSRFPRKIGLAQWIQAVSAYSRAWFWWFRCRHPWKILAGGLLGSPISWTSMEFTWYVRTSPCKSMEFLGTLWIYT